MTTELTAPMPATYSPVRPWPIWRRFAGIAGRYGLSASGPLGISIAHFIAAVLLLQVLPPAEFGLISFVLIIVPFCLSASGALLGSSVSAAIIRTQVLAEAELSTHLKANLAFSALAGASVGALMFASGASPSSALLFGLYGGLIVLRYFGRAYLYAMNQRLRVTLSDFTYGCALLAGLWSLFLAGQLTILNGAAVFAASALLALMPFGASFLRNQFWPAAAGSLRAYKTIWHEITRWSVFGVILTELTVNAHAYLITFICGSKTFALLAVGALFMRPVSLCLSALPDLERPAMTRKIAANDFAGARRSAGEFRMTTAAVWLATLGLSTVLLIWFPQLVLKHGYDLADVCIVVGLWALIMAVRTLRTPESVLLQAARQYRSLAKPPLWSSLVSLTVTSLLLFFIGPIASLGGILVGDLVMAGGIFSLSRSWRRLHG